MKTRFKPKFNIKKGDNVVVITGDDKDLYKPRKVKEVLVEEGKVIGRRCKHRYQAHQAFCTEYQRWNYEKRSSDPYQQCDAVGCSKAGAPQSNQRKKRW